MRRSAEARTVKHPPSCHERALRLLAVRPRTRRELERRLRAAGFEPEEVDEELNRLASVSLVDDVRFALEFAEHAVTRKGMGRRAVASSLAAKGVDRPTIEVALQRLGNDEEGRALELARARARTFSGLTPEVATRRLVSFLARRGYDGRLARWAATRALGLDAGPDG
jgi:regulatory protein